MTWAEVRNGKVVAHARFDGFEDLADWMDGRRGELVLVGLHRGESVEVGARVEVTDLLVRFGELAAAGR